MKRHIYSGNEERVILTALIVHDHVLAVVYNHTRKEKEPFRSRWSNLIAQWCFAHFEKFKRAPGRSIQIPFQHFSEKTHDEESVDMIETFLNSLSSDYKALAEELNAQFVVDLASTYFDKIRLSRIATTIEEAIDRNDLNTAREAQDGYRRLEFASNAWKDPFAPEMIAEKLAWIENDKPIVNFRGALGRFLSPYFKRGGFITFCGPEKRGKSFWLQEVVWTALRQRCRVLYYVLGDMTESEVVMRLFRRATLRPIDEGFYRIPIRLTKNDDGQTETEVVERAMRPITEKSVREAVKKLRIVSASNDLRLKCKVEGGGVVSAGMIEKDVADFSRDGWAPDVVVIDYADELAPEPDTIRLDKRHQIYENWRVLRRIGLKQHALVVTATQASARSYDAKLIRKRDFSEDKRKNALVTGLIGLNQDSEEKRHGVYRLNWILLRGGPWTENQVVFTAGNLALGCPCMISTF